METNNTFECGTCFYQNQAEEFTPISASADFTALECPNCLNNDKENFYEVKTDKRLAA
jgi:hypothetical protein